MLVVCKVRVVWMHLRLLLPCGAILGTLGCLQLPGLWAGDVTKLVAAADFSAARTSLDTTRVGWMHCELQPPVLVVCCVLDAPAAAAAL
jgi:hypothetical protein